MVAFGQHRSAVLPAPTSALPLHSLIAYNLNGSGTGLTHLSIIPGAWTDPVLVSLVDEAIVVHHILLPLRLAVQIDSIP